MLSTKPITFSFSLRISLRRLRSSFRLLPQMATRSVSSGRVSTSRRTSLPIEDAPMLPQLSTTMRLSSGRCSLRRASILSAFFVKADITGMPLGISFSAGMP